MIWLNGTYHDTPDKLVDLDDRGLLLADGLFETMLVRDGKAVFLQEHLARLQKGLRLFGFEVSLSQSELEEVVRTLSAPHDGQGAVRLTVTRGGGVRGIVPPVADVTPTVFMSCAPLPVASDESISLVISKVRRNEGSPVSNIKSISYTDNILARQEAMAQGADEAIMLNNEGKVACASVANVFVILPDKSLVTPPLSAGCLAGVTRQKVFCLAKNLGLEVFVAPVSVTMLEESYVFLTNSLMGLRKAHLHGRGPAGHQTEALFARLQQGYSDLVAQDISGT
jgi:branched-subunit amino acid aminotransferase/4-amino-4-deoxychorismate lyase